jgi:A118 family predicted phage portal protein
VPLPTHPKGPWPPATHDGLHHDMVEAATWYGGSLDAIATFYGRQRDQRTTERRISRDRPKPSHSRPVHVPAAADVAATSADLLFGEAPAIRIPDAHQANATTEAKAVESHLETLIDQAGVLPTLLEGAEICAAIGGVYLRPTWDADIADHALLAVVHGDHGIPEFRHGRLVAVTLWSNLARLDTDNEKVVWRHLERHEPGHIIHGLYLGDERSVGIRMPLAAHPATATLAGEDQDDHTRVVTLPPAMAKGILARYVPNRLPNRRHRGLRVGQADTAGAYTIMDALDRTYSSWMRDIDLGQARIMIADQLLERTGRGGGATFDVDSEIFSPVSIDPAMAEKTPMIQPVDFKLRVADHAATAAALFAQIVNGAGYSPITFGLDAGGGGAATATEVRSRQGRTSRTVAKKRGYWTPQVEAAIHDMLAIDHAYFAGPAPLRPSIEWGDLLAVDVTETATSIDMLRRAQAISIYTAVRMAQPDLDEAAVKEEVARIQAENAYLVGGDPTGGLPAEV